MCSSIMIKIKLFTDQYNCVTSFFFFKRLLKLFLKLHSLVSYLNASCNAFHIFGARYRQDFEPCFIELTLGIVIISLPRRL